jgi:hypothetical protein
MKRRLPNDFYDDSRMPIGLDKRRSERNHIVRWRSRSTFFDASVTTSPSTDR